MNDYFRYTVLYTVLYISNFNLKYLTIHIIFSNDRAFVWNGFYIDFLNDRYSPLLINVSVYYRIIRIIECARELYSFARKVEESSTVTRSDRRDNRSIT